MFVKTVFSLVGSKIKVGNVSPTFSRHLFRVASLDVEMRTQWTHEYK